MNETDNKKEKIPSDFDLYKIALETRNKEIDLFWRRSNYFLVLNTAIGVGFVHNYNSPSSFFLSILGLIVSVIWLRVNFGSKYWQERWEGRLKKVEENLNLLRSDENKINFFAADKKTLNDDVEKHLNKDDIEHTEVLEKPKTIFEKSNEFLNKCIKEKPSVSRNMIWLSILSIIVWDFLLLFCLSLLSCLITILLLLVQIAFLYRYLSNK